MLSLCVTSKGPVKHQPSKAIGRVKDEIIAIIIKNANDCSDVVINKTSPAGALYNEWQQVAYERCLYSVGLSMEVPSDLSATCKKYPRNRKKDYKILN